MKATEFRIDNWVINSKGEEAKVQSLHKTTGSHNDWQPVPLTEEWLLKFGFEYCGGMGHKAPTNTSYWHFSLRNGFIPSIWLNNTITSDGYKGCEHVHQLQNLYYALTGKELTK